MKFFIVGLIVVMVFIFIAWYCFYNTNIDLKEQLKDKQKELDSLRELTKKTIRRYDDCVLQLKAYELKTNELESEIYKLKSQTKPQITEHRIIQVLPKSVTLKGCIRKPQTLEMWNGEEKEIKLNEMAKRIIAKDLVDQIAKNNLIQIDTEVDPVRLQDMLYYKIVVQKID